MIGVMDQPPQAQLLKDMEPFRNLIVSNYRGSCPFSERFGPLVQDHSIGLGRGVQVD